MLVMWCPYEIGNSNIKLIEKVVFEDRPEQMRSQGKCLIQSILEEGTMGDSPKTRAHLDVGGLAKTVWLAQRAKEAIIEGE